MAIIERATDSNMPPRTGSVLSLYSSLSLSTLGLFSLRFALFSHRQNPTMNANLACESGKRDSSGMNSAEQGSPGWRSLLTVLHDINYISLKPAERGSFGTPASKAFADRGRRIGEGHLTQAQ
eukprot:5357002-Pleurochrysis_carterae.AAC.1